MKRIGLLLLFASAGCDESMIDEPNGIEAADSANEPLDVPEAPIGMNAKVTKTYYVSNPNKCSNALRLTATGTGITEIKPSGCWIDYWGPAPTWDTLTSAGTSTLTDTWYIRGTAFDKDYTSATYQAWCGSDDLVTVKVTGTTVTKLTFWFTDDPDCIF
jgi:hypothetical protein